MGIALTVKRMVYSIVPIAVCMGFLGACATTDSHAAPVAEASLRMPVASGTDVYKKSDVLIDKSNAAEGYIMVQNSAGSKARKLRMTCGSEQYTYSLPAGETYTVLPLQLGDGVYTLTVFQNVKGNTYSTLFSIQLDVRLRDALLPYLYPNQYVDYSADDMLVTTSAQLTAGATSDTRRLKLLYNYVMREIDYDYDKAAVAGDGGMRGYLPVPDETLRTKKGICFDYSALLAAMLRAQGIPARLVIGYVAPGNYYHAWNRAYVDGEWKWMDATTNTASRQQKNYAEERDY